MHVVYNVSRGQKPQLLHAPTLLAPHCVNALCQYPAAAAAAAQGVRQRKGYQTLRYPLCQAWAYPTQSPCNQHCLWICCGARAVRGSCRALLSTFACGVIGLQLPATSKKAVAVADGSQQPHVCFVAVSAVVLFCCRWSCNCSRPGSMHAWPAQGATRTTTGESELSWRPTWLQPPPALVTHQGAF